MSPTLPQLSVWSNQGTEWAKVGDIVPPSDLTYEVRHLAPGTWQMTIPYDASALAILPDRLITIDWRGHRSTWTIESFVPASDETGAATLTVGGPGALSMLGWELAWPNPALALGAQPATGVVSGVAETVIRTLIFDNFKTRRGAVVTIPASLGRGTTVTARTRFANLLELVTRKARRGGIGITLGLVNTSNTRAQLTVGFYVSVDRSLRVRLSQRVGTVRDWSQTQTAPTVTQALVGGAGEGTTRAFELVSTTASNSAATSWGGRRTVFVEGPDSFDPPELQQAGNEALDAGAATTTLALTSAEAEGLEAFTHYTAGDTATGELFTGLEVVDVITAIMVSVSDTGVDVTSVFGDPDSLHPQITMAQMLAAQRSRIRAIEQRR